MNKKNIRHLARIIRYHPDRFTLSYWSTGDKHENHPAIDNGCGTAHCIAGFANILSGRKCQYDDIDNAADFLGIESNIAASMFWGTSPFWDQIVSKQYPSVQKYAVHGPRWPFILDPETVADILDAIADEQIVLTPHPES